MCRADLAIAVDCFMDVPAIYVGEFRGEIIAAEVVIPWTKDFWYGAAFIVDPRFRNGGFGHRLRDHVIGYSNSEDFSTNGVVVGESPLYLLDYYIKQHGFHHYNVVMYSYETDPVLQRSLGRGSVNFNYNVNFKIVPWSRVDFDRIMEYDNHCFIAPNIARRREFMRRWFTIPGSASFVAIGNDGRLLGYGCRRPGIEHMCHEVGPVYADSPDVANAILSRLLAQVQGHRVCMYSLGYDGQHSDLFTSLGLKATEKFLRVQAKAEPRYKCSPRLYVVTSADVCGF
jgi:GNAT superfamily N-acetyltransferase